TSVRGYTELYRSGATDDVDRVLDKIEEESGRMKLLVEDLLALTRAEGSRLNLRTVDLLELALSAASTARAAFPERSIEVVNDTSEVPVVKGDPDRLHQALLNLITNGLRHGGEGTAVTLRLHRDPAEDGHV
ncbi:two-component sensor histidine kinase, partial [Acinetobacter baumannii]|nr:two-component sensor histidine kinase [Acinetobacter baumannii]